MFFLFGATKVCLDLVFSGARLDKNGLLDRFFFKFSLIDLH